MTILVQIERSPNGWLNIYKDNKVVSECADLVLHKDVDIRALMSELTDELQSWLISGKRIYARVEAEWFIHTEINDEII